MLILILWQLPVVFCGSVGHADTAVESSLMQGWANGSTGASRPFVAPTGGTGSAHQTAPIGRDQATPQTAAARPTTTDNLRRATLKGLKELEHLNGLQCIVMQRIMPDRGAGEWTDSHIRKYMVLVRPPQMQRIGKDQWPNNHIYPALRWPNRDWPDGMYLDVFETYLDFTKKLRTRSNPQRMLYECALRMREQDGKTFDKILERIKKGEIPNGPIGSLG